MDRDKKIEYLRKIRRYYNMVTPAYLRCMGTTLQGGLIRVENIEPDARRSNVYIAIKAEIQSGHWVLDAGCGVCGPSIDIAQSIPNLHIAAITISPVQANLAKKFVHHAGLAEHIEIAIADYHDLPFCDSIFDRAMFLESSEYSYDRKHLFREVYRVLRPCGILYIKYVFIEDRPLTDEELLALSESEEVYALRLATMRETANAIKEAGFKKIDSQVIDDVISTDHFARAMVYREGNRTELTELGKLHVRPTMHLHTPVHFGEIKAYK